MVVKTIPMIEKFLDQFGFPHEIPINKHIFAGGDGNVCEEAPIGYYRFHFWKNDDEWQDHENWICKNEIIGLFCISMIKVEERSGEQVTSSSIFYRLLIRSSLFGTKSMIIFEQDLKDFVSGGKPSSLQLIALAMKQFIDYQSDEQAAIEEGLGASSIQTNSSLCSISSELVRSLPSSRLRQSPTKEIAGNIPDPFPSRSPSIRRQSFDSKSETEIDVEPSSATRTLKKLQKMNMFDLAKEFTKITSIQIYPSLLALETSMHPKNIHFDVVSVEENTNDDVKDPLKLIKSTIFGGNHLILDDFERETGMLKADINTCLIDTLNNTISDLSLSAPQKADQTELDTKKFQKWQEFIENEEKYVQKLELINEIFLEKIDESLDSSLPEFRNIFADFPKFLEIHKSFLCELEEAKRNMNGGVLTFDEDYLINAVHNFSNGNRLLVYSGFYEQYLDRQALIKSTLNSSFDVSRKIDSDPRAQGQRLDTIFANSFQHPTRYTLQIETILKCHHRNSNEHTRLLKSYQRLHSTVTTLSEIKEKREQTFKLFSIQRALKDCPPTFITANRRFLCKMAVYEVEKGKCLFDKRLTLFLFNDCLVGAWKLRKTRGKLPESPQSQKCSSRRASSHQPQENSHQIIFIDDLTQFSLQESSQLARSGQKKSKAFSITLSPNSQLWTNGVDDDEEDASKIASWLLTPKRLGKYQIFTEKLGRVQEQRLLKTTMAQIYTVDYGHHKLYFHCWRMGEYLEWSHKNKVLIVHEKETDLMEFDHIDLLLQDCEGLMILQEMKGAWRTITRSRELIIASAETYKPISDFTQPNQKYLGSLYSTLLNCALMHSIYPPWTHTQQQSQQLLLKRYLEPFTKGLQRRLRKFVNRFKSASKNCDQESDLGADPGHVRYLDTCDNDEESLLQKNENDKRKGFMGRLFGKANNKSPLSKLK